MAEESQELEKPRINFPGQVPQQDFNLEQVRSLASPIRSEVFWSFSSREKFSVAEVAKSLGKSAQTVHYHVNELVKVGLLIAVGERKQRARIEKLYAQKALLNLSKGHLNTREYRDEVVRGFSAMARSMVKEYEMVYKVMDFDPDIKDWTTFRRALLRVDSIKLAALKRRLVEVIEDAALYDVGPEGTQINVSVYVGPALGVTRNWKKKKPR